MADRMLWLEEYACGCSFVGPRKELPGYCPRHGDSKRKAYRIGKESEQNMNLKRGLAP